MEYTISYSLYGVEPDLIRAYKDDLLEFLKQEFIFKTTDFDIFFLVLNYYPENMMEEFGADHLKVSKKERAIFLGVNLFNEVILNPKMTYSEKLQYHFNRINEVKELYLPRLVKNGLV